MENLIQVAHLMQVVHEPVADVVATPQFFVSLVAGILLAIAFQIILTALSVASGVSAIGNVEDKYHEDDNTDAGAPNVENRNVDHDGHKHNDPRDRSFIGPKIGSAFGIWALITTSIALFFAALLAVKLALIANVIIGITLGLVVWAAFFSLMAYLEIKSVSTLIGSLLNTVLSGLKASASAIQDMFTASKEKKIEKVTENAIQSLRREFDDALDLRPITDKIDKYMKRMDKKTADYDQMKKDFIKILKDIRIEEGTNPDDDNVYKETFIKLASEQPNVTKKDLKKMGNVFQQAQEAVKSESTTEGKAKKLASQFTKANDEDVDNYVRQVEEYLSNTGHEEVSPEAIRNDIERITQDPKHAHVILSERFQKMDRSTLEALLAQNDKIGPDRAHKIAGYVEDAFNFVKTKYQDKNKTGSDYYQAGTQGLADMPMGTHTVMETDKKGFEGKIRDYFNRTEKPELDYAALKQDFKNILSDPKSSPEIIKSRLSQFDKETLIALLTNNDKISREDVEKVATTFEETKNDVLTKVEKVQREIEYRVEQAKQEAVHQAEHARKTTATAAWWLVGTAIVSGLAAAAGGWIGVI